MKYCIYNKQTGEIILKRHTDPFDEMIIRNRFCSESRELFISDVEVNATHIINNVPVTITPEPIPPTEAEIIASLTKAVQGHLDSTARTRNYDGILSLCSYATSLDPVFHAEGQAGVEWRDAVWRMAYVIMAEVKAGTRPVPTPGELIDALPEMLWPI